MYIIVFEYLTFSGSSIAFRASLRTTFPDGFSKVSASQHLDLNFQCCLSPLGGRLKRGI